MKLRLLILLAAALAAAPAAGQTIKSLGYNTTNGQIVYSGTNALTFTNALQFSTNARATTRTNLGGTTVGNSVFTATNAAAAATAIGLGATNNVTFDRLLLGSTTNTLGVYDFYAPLAKFDEVEIGGHGLAIDENGYLTLYTSLYFNNTTNAATTRTNLGLGATNAVTFSNITASGTLAVSNTATFSTNVSIAGSLSVGSFTTTTPSTWALDATQTAAATNGVLTLPSNANVLRITNANTISGVSNGILGAFYFLINQSGTNVVISNSATITARGATNITLGANESATLITTTATNATAH
jgi:hypothetical protein